MIYNVAKKPQSCVKIAKNSPSYLPNAKKDLYHYDDIEDMAKDAGYILEGFPEELPIDVHPRNMFSFSNDYMTKLLYPDPKEGTSAYQLRETSVESLDELYSMVKDTKYADKESQYMRQFRRTIHNTGRRLFKKTHEANEKKANLYRRWRAETVNIEKDVAQMKSNATTVWSSIPTRAGVGIIGFIGTKMLSMTLLKDMDTVTKYSDWLGAGVGVAVGTAISPVLDIYARIRERRSATKYIPDIENIDKKLSEQKTVIMKQGARELINSYKNLYPCFVETIER